MLLDQRTCFEKVRGRRGSHAAFAPFVAATALGCLTSQVKRCQEEDITPVAAAALHTHA